MVKGKHKGVDPRVETAQGWRKRMERKTGKSLFTMPPGGELASASKKT